MNAALFLPNWVGDVVMATPAIQAMRQYARGGADPQSSAHRALRFLVTRAE